MPTYFFWSIAKVYVWSPLIATLTLIFLPLMVLLSGRVTVTLVTPFPLRRRNDDSLVLALGGPLSFVQHCERSGVLRERQLHEIRSDAPSEPQPSGSMSI